MELMFYDCNDKEFLYKEPQFTAEVMEKLDVAVHKPNNLFLHVNQYLYAVTNNNKHGYTMTLRRSNKQINIPASKSYIKSGQIPNHIEIRLVDGDKQTIWLKKIHWDPSWKGTCEYIQLVKSIVLNSNKAQALLVLNDNKRYILGALAQYLLLRGTFGNVACYDSTITGCFIKLPVSPKFESEPLFVKYKHAQYSIA